MSFKELILDTTITTSEKKKIDILRGFLALYIVGFHWFSNFTAERAALVRLYQPFFGQGYVAVQIFFGISGFLIVHSYAQLEKQGHKRLWLTFFIKRIFKIIPAWFVALLFYAVYTNSSIKEFFWNFFLLFGFKPFKFSDIIAIHSWSIFVELTFYFAFPIFIFIWNRKYFPIAITLYLLLQTYYFIFYRIPEGYQFYPPFVTFQYFFFGIIIFVYWTNLQKIQSHFLLTLAIQLFTVFLALHPNGKYNLIYVFLSLSFLFILAPESLFTKPLIIFEQLGKICYSLYLIHLYCLRNTDKILDFFDLSEVSAQEPLLSLFVGCAFSIVAAYALYYFIERPGVKLGRILADKLNNNYNH